MQMRLSRIGPSGQYVVTNADERTRVLLSDPFAETPSTWHFGRDIELDTRRLLPPVEPGKIVGVGRNYVAHAHELSNPVPKEPVLFLKSPSSVIGPGRSIVLPPESQRVDFEGELALVLNRTLRRASEDEARASVLGVTAACDVTARDLQRQDPTFARAKSFDSFCPLGPTISIGADLDHFEIRTRINGAERQRGSAADMLFSPVTLLAYISRMMTLEPSDIVLTGTPAGVGPLVANDQVEVELTGVGVLSNPVASWEPT